MKKMIRLKWIKNITLFGKYVFLLFGLIWAECVVGQQLTIAKAVGNEINITEDTAVLSKALTLTVKDGSRFDTLYVISHQKRHYLVGIGTYRNMQKTIAVELFYHIQTRTYQAKTGLGYVTCTSAACSTCDLFLEHGKIIGCKCSEKSTISNQCNFTQVQTADFYRSIVRAKQILLKNKP